MNVIAKISCYLEHGVVTLKSRKEYLNSVTHTTSAVLRINNWTVWYIERYSMSTYTRVTNCQKTVRFFFGPPCICTFPDSLPWAFFATVVTQQCTRVWRGLHMPQLIVTFVVQQWRRGCLWYLGYHWNNCCSLCGSHTVGLHSHTTWYGPQCM